VLRISRRPSRFTTTWRDAERIAERWPGGYCHGDIGRGIARIVLPLGSDVADTALRSALDVPFDGHRIYERLPRDLWSVLVPTAIRNRLERDVKTTFDPQEVLNPGIFGEMQ
jgi:hypothetical protein